MRSSVLIILVILSLFAFLYFSSQLEGKFYKEKFALAKCKKALILNVPKAFLHPNTYQTTVLYVSKTKTINFNQTKITGLPNDFFENSDCIEQLVINNNVLETIPRTIKKLKNLQYISLSNNKIKKIPRGFFSSFENLSSADLSKNNLKVAHIEKTKLQELALNNNNLQQLIIQDSTSINSLNISNNQLVTFPKEILNIKNLYTLNLKNNYIHDFSSLSNIPLINQSTLETLILDYNPVREFPTGLKHFPNLSSIDLYSCELQGTVKIDGFPSLNLLEINNQKITKLILKENNLGIISLSNNRIREVIIEGPEAGQQVITLNLSSNPLKRVPEALKNLINLSELHLKNTQLTNVDNFDKFPFKSTLNWLDLSFNRLKTYPDLSDYTELRNIELSHNQLTNLPAFNMAKLKRLDLSNNLITHLNINELSASVEELILSSNNIKEITGDKVKENLKTLDLSHNLTLYGLDRDFLTLFPNLQQLNLFGTNIKGVDKEFLKKYCELNYIKVDFGDDLAF